MQNIQYNALPIFRNAAFARSKLAQDRISSFYGSYLLMMVHVVSDLPDTCKAAYIVHQSTSHT